MITEFLSDLQELRVELRKAGADASVIDAAIVQFVADVDFSRLIPAPFGAIVEAMDDPIAQLGIAAKIAGLFRRKEGVRRKTPKGERRANQPDPVEDPADAPTEEPAGN